MAKKSKIMWIVLSIVIVLVLIGAGVGVYYGMMSQEKYDGYYNCASESIEPCGNCCCIYRNQTTGESRSVYSEGKPCPSANPGEDCWRTIDYDTRSTCAEYNCNKTAECDCDYSCTSNCCCEYVSAEDGSKGKLWSSGSCPLNYMNRGLCSSTQTDQNSCY